MVSRGDKLFGAWLITLGVLSLAWFGFMSWLIYTLAEWLVSK